MHFTLLCNLKCKLCTSYSPYYKKPYYLCFERCREVIDRFFEIFTTCDSYLILGGEPLIHKDMPQILNYLKRYLPQIANKVRINSNGSILVNDRLIAASKQFGDKIHYIFDDYGASLSVHAKENINRLRAAGVSCEIRDYASDKQYCGGWVDFSDMITIKNTVVEADALFNKCLCAPWKKERSVNLYDGEMYICGQSKFCMEKGAIPKRKPEYVDIFESSCDIPEIRRQITEFMTIKTHTACRYCTGITRDSKRFPAAEQLRIDDKVAKI
jgi:hypothetical protein